MYVLLPLLFNIAFGILQGWTLTVNTFSTMELYNDKLDELLNPKSGLGGTCIKYANSPSVKANAASAIWNSPASYMRELKREAAVPFAAGRPIREPSPQWSDSVAEGEVW